MRVRRVKEFKESDEKAYNTSINMLVGVGNPKGLEGQRKGQVSFELLVVVGFVLAIFIPILFYVYTQAKGSVIMSQNTFMDNYADTLASAANMVAFSGNSSYIALYVNVPKGVKTLRVDSKAGGSMLVVQSSSSEFAKYVNAPLVLHNTDKLKRPGMQSIKIYYNGNTVVIE